MTENRCILDSVQMQLPHFKMRKLRPCKIEPQGHVPCAIKECPCPRVSLHYPPCPQRLPCTHLFSCPPRLFCFSCFSFLLNSVRESFAGPSGLGYQLPLLLAPRAIKSELKCLRFRLGRSLSHPGRAGSPEQAHLPGLIGQNDDVKPNLSLEKC